VVAEGDIVLGGVGALLTLVGQGTLHVLLLCVNCQTARVPVKKSTYSANEGRLLWVNIITVRDETVRGHAGQPAQDAYVAARVTGPLVVN